MKDWVLHYWANPWIALLLYWLPLALCGVGYVVRTWKNFRIDVMARAKAEREGVFYFPTDTIGVLIGRGIISIIPVANLCAAAFDLAPEMLNGFFKWLGKIFNHPLVPRRQKT